MSRLRLGLIGDNIGPSRSPDLHNAAGRMTGLDVTYERLIPAQMGLSFDETFDFARASGFAGVNVTLPYKERVLARLDTLHPVAREIGAVNTVRFGADGPEGFNTDHSGFIASFHAAMGGQEPGRVALIGAGGVGKAIAFALRDLGAEQVIVIDTRAEVAEGLSAALRKGGATGTRAGTLSDLSGADGVVNATPLGMAGYPGSAVPEGAFPATGWAFDAVYTPEHTPFRAQAQAAGARFISGWELFFHQGVDAFEIFTGHRPADTDALRAALRDGQGGSAA